MTDSFSIGGWSVPEPVEMETPVRLVFVPGGPPVISRTRGPRFDFSVLDEPRIRPVPEPWPNAKHPLVIPQWAAELIAAAPAGGEAMVDWARRGLEEGFVVIAEQL